jgi:hypothetical protein
MKTESLLKIKYVFHFTLQLLSKIFFTQKIFTKLHSRFAQMHEGFCVKQLLKLRDLNENRKFTENKICVSFYSRTFVQNIFHSENIYQVTLQICTEMHEGLCVKWFLKLPNLNKNWSSSTIFHKILKYQISWKSIQQFLSCFTWTDRRTDWMNLIGCLLGLWT